MISDRGIANLRMAATMAHVLPGLRLRLSDGGRTVLEVRVPTPPDDHDAPARACTPCAFRASVAHAHARHRAGERLGFMDLPDGHDPRIEIGVPPQGAALGAGLFRVHLEDRWLWALASTLPVGPAHEIGEEVAQGCDDLPDDVVLGVRWDEATEITVAYAELAGTFDSADEAAVVDLLHSMLARWSAEQLIGSLDDPVDRPTGQR